MRYILEIVVEKKDQSWECVDTIESESAIPIPAVGDQVMTPNGWLARVINRQFWFTYVNRVPLVKIEIQCRRSPVETVEAEPERPRRRRPGGPSGHQAFDEDTHDA
jgi:hypothetical protein